LLTDEIPLTSTVLIRLIVAFPGKIEPFGMAELVADEVEISFASERVRDESIVMVAG
jgi:hypothetical protein